MTNRFTLEYWNDEGWFVGKLKEIPNVFSQGETLEELIENIKEVYSLLLAENEIEDRNKTHEIPVEVGI